MKRNDHIPGVSSSSRGSLWTVLIIVLSIICFAGLYSAGQAEAAVSTLDDWAEVYQATNPTSPVTSGSFAVSSGTARLLVISICMEIGTGNVTATFPNVELDGPGGTSFTLFADSGAVSSRMHCYLGYLNDAQAAAGNHTIYAAWTLSANTATGIHIKRAVYQGVDQTTPTPLANGSRANAAANATVSFGGQLDYTDNGMAVLTAAWGGNGGAIALTNAPNFTENVNGRDNANAGFSDFIAETGTLTPAGNYPGTTSVTLSGGTGTRSALVVASLNPAPTDTVSVTGGTNPPDASVTANDTNKTIDGFTMTASAGTPQVTQVTATVANPSDLANIRLYRDTGTTIGTYDASDVLLQTVTSPTGTVNFGSLTETPATTGTRYIIVGNIAGSPGLGDAVTAVVSGLTVTSPAGAGTITDSSATLTIVGACVRSAPTVVISPSSQNAVQGGAAEYTLTVTNNDTGGCGDTTFTLAWTNTPAMNNANFSTSGQSATIGPISVGASSPTLTFTHNASVSDGTTQQTYVAASSANHSAVTSNTVTSTAVPVPQVPAGNVVTIALVSLGILFYGTRRSHRKKSSQ